MRPRDRIQEACNWKRDRLSGQSLPQRMPTTASTNKPKWVEEASVARSAPSKVEMVRQRATLEHRGADAAQRLAEVLVDGRSAQYEAHRV